MDDPPIDFDFNELDDDYIFAELASRQVENTESDYAGRVVSSPGSYVVVEEEMQPYVDGHVPMEGMQHDSERDVWAFGILDLPSNSFPMDGSNDGMLPSALTASSASLPFIPSLPGQVVNHEGTQDSMSDWTFPSPAPSCVTLDPFAPPQPNSSMSDSFDSFDSLESFTSYSEFPITTLSAFQGLLDIEGPITSYDDWSTIGAQAAGYEVQEVVLGNGMMMVHEEQEDFQQNVTDRQTIPSAQDTRTNNIRRELPTYATMSESPSAISESSGRSTASADGTEEEKGEGRGRGGTRKKKKREQGGTCKQCHRVFTREADARRHELARHGCNQISCMACGKPCSRPDALKRHIDSSCGKGRKPGRKPKVPK
ncbi:uncharacterized protein STEHIDRAFT_163270 [Stereum hirsutum FP-91666 SS1]|uniref:C2H2-type domain-containing protein n=1 Tax=Stereum hirsutum (strain FP-91666) TaxID=721885 RepID=R7RYN9_STEHR|nr:uncharacterized protein STEHIDRAFT_163270 [Stereum hirsutum FP-91666 SS1]EIM80020.1 hypothetical protein STEHIDRAFT_163270 [Stereum hirsutum FP-91666 SS1]